MSLFPKKDEYPFKFVEIMINVLHSLCEIYIFCNQVNVFVVGFDQMTASLLNRSIHFLK